VSHFELRIFAIPGIPEIQPGDDLGAIIVESVQRTEIIVVESDVVVIAQKVVSKAEGQIVKLDSVRLSPRAIKWAKEHQKDPRVVELVFQQARRIVRMERGVLIVETAQGFVCANAGVDVSNTPLETATLLPQDPDQSAARLQAYLTEAWGVSVGVIISDTFGRPWREGLVNVAIGVAGIAPLVDYRGRKDTTGRLLQTTIIAVADELASAAELVMGKTTQMPVALIRGFPSETRKGRAADLLRRADQDLFR
jgi:coenzyme F420-0:L-glutamate ligase / coenzyme F420-1:gamma-L-glutamate ligase